MSPRCTLNAALTLALTAGLLAGGAAPAQAQVKIGATLSATGPQASLGIPERNTVSLLPAEIGGAKVEYVVLDDASDPTRAVSNSHKLISENKVDLIIGSSTTPNTMAMLDTVAAGATPVITLASSARLIEPMDDKRRWVFKTPHSDSLMAEGIARHAAAQGVKKLAFIGFNNALGETFWVEVEKAARSTASSWWARRASRPRTPRPWRRPSLVGAAPDAVVGGVRHAGRDAGLASAATRARSISTTAWPTTTSCASAALRGRLGAGGAGDGGRPAARQPSGQGQRPGLRRQYEAVHGAGSVSLFAAYTWDVALLLQQAVPVALKAARPARLNSARARDALENEKPAHGHRRGQYEPG